MQESLFSASCIPSHELDLHVRTRGRLQCPTQPRVRAHVHVLVRTLHKLDLASVCVYLPEVICKKKNYIWSCSDRRSSACLCCLWIYFSKVIAIPLDAQAIRYGKTCTCQHSMHLMACCAFGYTSQQLWDHNLTIVLPFLLLLRHRRHRRLHQVAAALEGLPVLRSGANPVHQHMHKLA